MEHLVNFTITKVYEAEKKDGTPVEGTGKYGFWKLYSFYTDQTDDKKFSWFGGDKKVTPVKGMQVEHMEYEVVKDGGYTNYDVKKLEPKEGAPQPTNPTPPNGATPNSAPTSKDRGVYTSYAMEIAKVLIQSGGTGDLHPSLIDLDNICQQVGKAGLIMMNESLGNAEISSDKPQDAPTVNDKPKPTDTPPIDKANDPRKDMIKCEVVKEKGIEKHKEPVVAIFCLTSCQETAKCKMAGELRIKYPGFELKQEEK